MRSKRGFSIAVVVGLIVGVFALWGRQGAGQEQGKPPMATWEYKTLPFGTGDPTDSLNELGRQGWELVTFGGNQVHTLFVLKRPK